MFTKLPPWKPVGVKVNLVVEAETSKKSKLKPKAEVNANVLDVTVSLASKMEKVLVGSP